MAATPQPQSVFLSYSVADRQFARDFASALEQIGVDVWWDLSRIPVGADWTEFLLDKVLASACTVVLWSHHSAKSEWVLREATAALQRRVLCPVLIDDVPIPNGFTRIQTARLTGWDGNPKDPRLEPIFRSVLNFFQNAPSPAEETRAFKQSQRSAELRAQELFQQNYATNRRWGISSSNTPICIEISAGT
jgi:hypothetical protein